MTRLSWCYPTRRRVMIVQSFLLDVPLEGCRGLIGVGLSAAIWSYVFFLYF